MGRRVGAQPVTGLVCRGRARHTAVQPHTTTLALQVGQTPIQDEQSRTVSALEAAQLRGKVLPFIVGVVTVDLALASFYWGVYVPYYAEQEAPQ